MEILLCLSVPSVCLTVCVGVGTNLYILDCDRILRTEVGTLTLLFADKPYYDTR
jgi:hypothetical protein